MNISEQIGSGFDEDDHYVSCPFPDISFAEQCVRIASVVFVMLLSLSGNVLVIYVVRKNRKLQTVTHYFITNLAAADLLITVFNMAELLQRQISGSDEVFAGISGRLYCRAILFIQNISLSCSILTITAIAVERFCAIIFPLKKIITMRIAKSIMAAVWVSSCAISSPFLYASRSLDYNGDGSEFYCVEEWEPLNSVRASQVYYALFFCLAYLLPLIVISALYTSIGLKLHRRAVSGNRSFGHAQRRTRMVRRVVKMLVAVVIAFALCWLPQHVSLFFNYFVLDACPPEALWFGGELLGYSNSAVNPCIYIIFHAEYRLEFWRILHKILPCFRQLNEDSNIGRITETRLPSSHFNMVTFVSRTTRRNLSESTFPASRSVVMTRFNSVCIDDENCL